MMRRLLHLFICLLALGPLLVHADVQLSATRVIFTEGKREASLIVRDRSEDSPPHLIQSWVTDAGEAETSKITVVPPLFRLEPGGSRTLRIIKTESAMPTDRETLYWLNVKVIPPSDKDAEDVLKTVVVFQLKVLYRPSILSRKDASEAYRRLTFTRSADGRLQVGNPTPFYVSLAHLKVDGVEVPEAALLGPHETNSYPVASEAPHRVTWIAVDDFGVMSKEMSFSF